MLLDGFFPSQLNVPFERHRFRQMEQTSGQSVDQFVCRLRQKAIICEFEKVDEAIRNQLIKRCRDSRLRRKFLEKSNATLKDLQDLVRVQEAVNMQVKAMDQLSLSGQVNAVLFGRPQNTGKGKGIAQGRDRGNKSGKHSGGCQGAKVMRCFRSNYSDHIARDRNCPARNQKCNTCGEVGHFAICCKTKERKAPSQDSEKRRASGGRAYQVSENSATGAQDYYAFEVGAGAFAGGSKVDLKVGGVMLPVVLIDSGASCNVIDLTTWEAMKKESVQCDSKKSSKKLFAYGEKERIELCLKLCVGPITRRVLMNSQLLRVQADLYWERALRRNWKC